MAVEEADARASVRRVHPGVRPAEVGEAAVADLVAERHARRAEHGVLNHRITTPRLDY